MNALRSTFAASIAAKSSSRGFGETYPAVTATVLTPVARQARATSIAYSMKTTGSLYVNATLRQPSSAADAAMRSGDAESASVSISRDFEMSQFWQNRQARLQPAVPKERTDVPGRKWFRGFFSIGSTQKPLDRPYVVRTIAPPRAPARSSGRAGPPSAGSTRADVALDAFVFDGVPVSVGWVVDGQGSPGKI